MLKRISERDGHTGAIYDLVRSKEGFYSAAADGYLVHWHREDENFGRMVALVEGGKFFCMTTLQGGGLVAGTLAGGVHWLYPDDPGRNRHVAQHSLGVFACLRLGGTVFTAGGDGVLTRWDATTGQTVESIRLSGNSLRCLAADHEGAILLVGASDGRVYSVSRDSLAVLGTMEANQPSTFTVAPLPEAEAFISGGRDAQLRFGSTFHPHADLPEPINAHSSTVNALAFSPNGQYLATASRDKTVKLWSVDGLRIELLKVAEVIRDRGHINSVNCLLWLDDETLITAGDDRRILEWRVG